MASGITSGNQRPSLRKVEGAFFRSVLTDRVQNVLAPPAPESAGRYHRLGQATLYMSPTIEWATIAVSGYMREDNRPRVVVIDARATGGWQVGAVEVEIVLRDSRGVGTEEFRQSVGEPGFSRAATADDGNENGVGTGCPHRCGIKGDDLWGRAVPTPQLRASGFG